MAELYYPYVTVLANMPEGTMPQIILAINDGSELDEIELAHVVRDHLASLPGATNVRCIRESVVSNVV